MRRGSKRTDEADLRGWLETAAPGESRAFCVSKPRREALHRLCDELAKDGWSLTHESQSAGKARALLVRLLRRPGAKRSREEAGSDAGFPSPAAKRHLAGSAVVDPHGTDARARAAAAALARHAPTSAAPASRDLFGAAALVPDDDDPELALGVALSLEAAVNTHAKSKPSRPSAPVADVIDLSVDDDSPRLRQQQLDPPQSTARAPRQRRLNEDGVIDLCGDDGRMPRQRADVIDLCDGDEGSDRSVGNIHVLPDIQERVRNADPRAIMNAVRGTLAAAASADPALSDLAAARAEPKALMLGDYAWVRDASDGRVLVEDALIERKSIADLVGGNGRHVSQLARMAACGLRNVFLLLEGRPATAGDQIAYGKGPVRTDADINDLCASLAATPTLRVRALHARQDADTARLLAHITTAAAAGALNERAAMWTGWPGGGSAGAPRASGRAQEWSAFCQ